MIYTPGFQFKFADKPKLSANPSLEQRILAKKQINTSLYDNHFRSGFHYQLMSIAPFRNEDNQLKLNYKFLPIDEAMPPFNVEFNNAQEADDCIAAMSGNVQEVQRIRQQIAKAQIDE